MEAINYSILNNYEFESKSKLSRTLDSLASPLLGGLGGRKINIVNNKSSCYSKTRKIVTLLFLILLAPIALVPLTALTLKALTDRKNRVHVFSILNKTPKNLNSPPQAETIKPSPKAETPKPQRTKTLEKTDLVDVAISPTTSIEAAMQMIDVEINNFIEKNPLDLSAESAIKFILRNLPDKKFSTIEKCCRKLLCNSLHPSLDQPFLQYSQRKTLGRALINYFKDLSLSFALTPADEERIEETTKEMNALFTRDIEHSPIKYIQAEQQSH